MSPQSQLRWTIIAALLMWSPAGFAVVMGSSDILRSGILFVGALILAYIGVTIIAYLINSYAQTQQMVARAQRQIEIIERREAEDAEAAAEEERKRRSDD
jgi:arginine exporter protein ArgO